jgi:cytochrome b subunit of formate dehydrogenase
VINNELYSIAMLFESWADENLTEEEAINKLLYVVGNDFQNKSDCKFFCKVWKGIKKAANWVWDNYKEISALLNTGITLYNLF